MKILFVCGQHNYGDRRRGLGYEYGNIRPALIACGHEVVFFESWDKGAYGSFADLNRQLLDRVARERPDVVFLVLMNCEVWIETLDAIRERCGSVVINWAPDDSWKFRESSRFLLPHLDLHCTTHLEARDAAGRAGFANALLTQWAASSMYLAPPRPAKECHIPVSFVGTAYGNRRRWVEELRRRGIAVECFGHGWPNGAVTGIRLREIIRDSVITLNFGDSGLIFENGRLRRSRQIKARIFEVPGAGGFLLTEGADGLNEFYQPNTEVVVFGDVDDLARKIGHYLNCPDERDAIAAAAFKRTETCHTYEHRLKPVLDAIERIHVRKPLQIDSKPCAESVEWLSNSLRSHELNSALRVLRALVVMFASMLVGRRRGARAARKLVYELSWRLAGERTYRASGLPGRLFYREC